MNTSLPALVLVVASGLWAGLVAQCNKPGIPGTGLPVTVIRDIPITYSDGYKTLANLTYPQGTVPSCGWPLVVFVHGYGGRRSVQAGLARRGFAVLAPDVRGQGDAKNLNPRSMGMTFYGATEKYDLAEVIAFGRGRWPRLLSRDKLAVTGGSQGGIHSWFAAAYSGQAITIAGRGSIVFPRVTCVVPYNFIPEVQDHMLRGGTLFAVDGINRAFGGNNAAVLDPGLIATIRTAFLAQDPLALGRTWSSEAGRPVAPLLAQCRVPVLYYHAWLDQVEGPRDALIRMATIPSSTPVRAMLSTIGHGSPTNRYEAAFRREEQIRWFDRFLWGIRNGVDTDAPFVHGVAPPPASLRNPASLWEHRFDAASPASDLMLSRQYLRADGTLANTPGAAGAPTLIRNQVNPSYTPARFIAAPGAWSMQAILRNIPLSQRVFTMPVLASERELGGAVRVSLRVVPSAERFVLSASLMARFPGRTEDSMLAIWGRGVLGARPGVPMRVAIDLPPAMYVLPKGTQLKLIVQNHWLRAAPMSRAIVTVPYFVSATTEVRHGTGVEVSYVELPFRAIRRVGLVSDLRVTTVAQPRDFPLDLRGGTTAAHKPYIIAVGLSGHTPPMRLPGGVLPLRWDPLSDAMLGLALTRSPLVPGFVGTLDAAGRSLATLRLSTFRPLPNGLVGARLSVAAWVYTSSANLTGSASEPLDLVFR